MCPFCISALALIAAKAVATGGGGAVLAKVALKGFRNGDHSSNSDVQVRAQAADGMSSTGTAQ